MRLALALLLTSTSSFADAPKTPKLTTKAAVTQGKVCKTQNGQEGQDPVTLCTGLDGYTIRLFSSAESSYASFEKGDFSAQVGGLKLGTIEWRLADGKPFAVIAEVTVRESDESKKQVKRFLVRGLQGRKLETEVAGTEAHAHDKAIAAADALFAAAKP